jgi:hypothetical protein
MKPARFIFAVLLMPPVVMAGTSANYTLAPDTVDAGGLRGTSGNYTVNGSATSGGAGSSANYSARTGFAGQLLDAVTAVATAIAITASSPTVSEGTTRQLGAILLYDDSTTAPLSAGSVAWSVQSGPLTGISASGLAAAAAVYQDTAAVARGTYQTFTATQHLTVLNTLPDNFSTYASDGIPDDWQVQYFGVDNPDAGPQLDPDSDGWDNRFEYNACLVPTDRISTFSMRITNVAGGGHAVTFSPRFAGCTYSLLGSSDLSLWAPVAGTVTDAEAVRSILDPAGVGGRRFYFISVQRH